MRQHRRWLAGGTAAALLAVVAAGLVVGNRAPEARVQRALRWDPSGDTPADAAGRAARQSPRRPTR